MITNRSTLLVILFFLFPYFQSALAIEIQSYTPSKFSLIYKNTIHTDENSLTSDEKDELIHLQIDQAWKKPKPKYRIQTLKPYDVLNFAEGTGTRGGGSGLLVKTSEALTEVRLLEIYRSENQNLYPLFFPIDEKLRSLETVGSTDEATRRIFEEVLSRISAVAPHFGSKIKTLYEIELPFKNWIAVFQDLPVVADEIKLPTEKNTNRIQIALRRTQFIFYNKRAYAAMTPLNRAALWLHEYLYALSGLENSLKTQRAVSLFFSSEFLKLPREQERLTKLFYDLDLLAISRQKLALPPGAQETQQKQTENCGLLTSFSGTPTSPEISYSVRLRGENKNFTMPRTQAVVVFSALSWGKAHIEKSFPIYKFYGQKTMPDQICFNADLSRVTQVQSSLAQDEEMAEATRMSAVKEKALFEARSLLEEAIEQGASETTFLHLLESVRSATEALDQAEVIFSIKLITPIETILNPKILGESIIAIDP